ncbi:MAG: HDIG domain-containing protein [Gemmatimonadetes bacterium]|nr:HDIG domain-containing protein [Gemmatimonadota bacterium]MYF71919.1 HDIG domain-containing protein [Gemmatimonadota bacterium]MYK51372.1 HDIG domain-containing protein [Gemmatimonadota bacterium]
MSLNRDDAFTLLTEHTENINLIKHMLAVEAAMRAYARKFGRDENLWGITGLLHDFDYEKHPTPEEHPMFGVAILEENGYPEAMIHAIKAHAPYLGVPRESLLDKALFAVDELTGFIVAVTLMQPTKKLADLKVSSVLKKIKQKGFARNVSREDILTGAEELGIELDDHIAFVRDAMNDISDDLGL